MTDSIRAALSQPEPASLSDEKIEAIFDKHGQYVYDSEEDMGAKVIFWGDFKTAAREIESAIAADRAQRQPVPGGVQELVKWLREQEGWMGKRAIYSRIANLLSQRHPQPVPVSERPWEREGWCDEQGKCWWFNPGQPAMSNPHIATSSWRLCRMLNGKPMGAYSLPAHALPLPSKKND